jgi:hypothetical protein
LEKPVNQTGKDLNIGQYFTEGIDSTPVILSNNLTEFAYILNSNQALKYKMDVLLLLEILISNIQLQS